jgi:5-methylcytosine-specific restriction endonuclease McrA
VPESTQERLLGVIAHLCGALDMTVDEALEEKGRELELRRFLKCRPNWRVKSGHLPDFVRLMIGQIPSDHVLASLMGEPRGGPLAEAQLISLEEQQHGRCALCGRFLVRASRPQVDHIVPVALGGKSELRNYQLLCAECNLGKGKLLTWLMGAPFFSDEGNGLSAKLRYCVLAYASGRCRSRGCEETSRTTELEVVPRVALAKGGRLIFDNLIALCQEHARKRYEGTLQGARRGIRSAAYRGLVARVE